MNVQKRDGSKQPFSVMAIVKAIKAAILASGQDMHINMADTIALEVMKKFAGREEVSIEDLQETVESKLLEVLPEAGRAYITYRSSRDRAREGRSKLLKEIQGLVDSTNLEVLNENANKDSKIIPTQRDLLAGIVSKHYALNYQLPPKIANAHISGDLHFHDLDYSPFFPMFNCMLVDLKGMLENGFKMGNAEITTPHSITTAAAVTAQIIAQVASHIYGGTTINRLDEVLAPYVKKSWLKHLKDAEKYGVKDKEGYAWDLTEREVYAACQGLEYEVNTLHTSNGQTPFVTFGFGLGESREAVAIQKAILKNRIAGLGRNHKTPVFPKLVFTLKRGLNLTSEDPNYDIKQLALECASKRMYPDILSYDKVVEVTGSFKAPMGCRSFLGRWVNPETGSEEHDGRNNLGVVSLNIPRIAMESKGNQEEFFKILDRKLKLAYEALMIRIHRLDNVKAGVAPILYMSGACGVRLNEEDSVAEIFKNGRASVSLGYIGLHEAMQAMFGTEVHPYDSKEAQDFAISVVRKLHDAVEAWTSETGYAFSVYSTPSESLCDRFCRLDTKKFGVIPGVTDKGYYTNSFHLDVEKKANPYDKIDFEQPYPSLASGGFICYGEYPNVQHNLQALEDVWNYAYDRVPYYGTNTPIDECYGCGYQGEFECTSKGFECPKCGNHDSTKVSVTRRVCGYLGSPDARPFNPGKQAEVLRRVKHLDSQV